MNLDSNRAILVAHETWSGGKFLIACLSLSDDCGFQDPASFSMTADQKYNHFKNELDLNNGLWHDGVYQPGTWSDFRMGNGLLLGSLDQYDPTTFSEDMKIISNGNKYFFINCHNTDELTKLIELWPASTVIHINNTKPFVVWRKGPSFTSEVNVLTDELEETFHRCNHCKLSFDGSSLLNKDRFVVQVNQLYDQIGLRGFNRERIEAFYQMYIQTLENLK